MKTKDRIRVMVDVEKRNQKRIKAFSMAQKRPSGGHKKKPMRKTDKHE